MPPLTVDLDRIAEGNAGEITFKGTTRRVEQISATSIALLRSAAPETYIETALTVVRRVVPSLTDDEAATLSVPQIEAILAIATNDVEEVAKLAPDYAPPDPNAHGPATDPTSPA